MAKPVVIAKSPAPDWTVSYVDLDTGDQRVTLVMGSPTIDDALREAKASLDITGGYRITRIELEQNKLVDDAPRTTV